MLFINRPVSLLKIKYMSNSQRPSGRAADALRPVVISRHFTKHAEGSVLIEFGDTRVICTASIEDKVPGF